MSHIERRSVYKRPNLTYDGEWIVGTNVKEGRGVLISRLGSVYEGWFH
jgi:hypothetical protein